MSINTQPFAPPGLPEPVQAPLGSWSRRLIQQLQSFFQTVATQVGVVRNDLVSLDTRLDKLQADLTVLQSLLTANTAADVATADRVSDLESISALHTTEIASLAARVTDLETL